MAKISSRCCWSKTWILRSSPPIFQGVIGDNSFGCINRANREMDSPYRGDVIRNVIETQAGTAGIVVLEVCIDLGVNLHRLLGTESLTTYMGA